ncbi:CorA family divalent cation transporter [Qipengyuania sp. SS22]|uniref:CorA family divalent cation transporter n=1 Tax=Qipengyuania sp. SS22 TaxID=2979461 RepID=UPI00398F9473
MAGRREPTAELLVSDQTRPRAFREGETLVGTLRGINFNPGAEPEDMISMQSWCDGRRLVTLLAELLIARMSQSIVDMNEVLDVLEQISRDAPFWFEEHDRREIAESIPRLRRYLDDIDISKESALVLQDEIRAPSLASSEHATYMLTIVAGIFLPLSFLTGLLGINVGGMPGMQDSDAFWAVVALCALLFTGLIVAFRRLRWL